MRANSTRSIAVAMLLAAVTMGAAPAPPAAPTTPPTPSPADALFSAARAARSQSAYAHYAVYATVVQFRNGGQPVTNTWDTIEDTRRRLVHSRALSRQEGAHPHVPHGMNIGVGGFGPSGVLPPGVMPPKGRIVSNEPTNDPIGQLTFAVDQDFGLALTAPPIGATANLSEVATTATTLPHIGRTGTIARTYEVTDLGDVVENTVALHHLGLRPLRDPHRYRLRELWTDATTSLPVRAIVAGLGNRGPLQNVNWRVEFTQLQGGTYITRETALGPLDTDNGRLDDVTITFAELRPTNRLKPEESIGLASDVGTTDP